LGHGLSYISLNHEYKFKSVNGRLRFAARYGIGCNPGFTIERTGNRIANVWSVPLVITSYLGRSNNFFVLGVGYTASFGRKWVDSNIYPTYTFNGFESSMIISAGYRRYFPYKTYFGIYPEMVISRHPFRFGIGLYLGGAFLTRENKKKRDK